LGRWRYIETAGSASRGGFTHARRFEAKRKLVPAHGSSFTGDNGTSIRTGYGLNRWQRLFSRPDFIHAPVVVLSHLKEPIGE
jgi:hypothetical protein